MTTALQSIEYIDISLYADFIQLLKICFARSKQQWIELLDKYEDFNREYKKRLDSKIIRKPDKYRSSLKKKQVKKYQLEDIKKWLYNLPKNDLVETPFYSPFSSDEKSFVDLDRDDLIQLEFWVRKLLLKIANDRRRKKKRNLVRGDLDLKYLIRNRFVKGDELVQLYYRYPKKEKFKIVFLCDVSKSMDLYSRFIISFMHQLPDIFDLWNICFFNTKLYPVKSPEAIEDIEGLWAGGTRIGHCLQLWLEQVPEWFDRKTKVIIYSDGWDTGDLDLLDQVMFKIHRMADKILWFNPVIKDENDIQASGMLIAKNYIDVLAPVYNLRTLKELVKEF